MTQNYNIGSEIWVPVPKSLAAQEHQSFDLILHNFVTWSRISPGWKTTLSIRIRCCKLQLWYMCT